MRLIIEQTNAQAGKWAANYIAKRIVAHQAVSDKPFVLGLPTGSTPLSTYKELIRLNKEGVVSFKNVVTFNMDEYAGLPEEHPESYHSFMKNNFFSHIDIDPANINILNGNAADLDKECADYEARIEAAGGIDLFLGGVGENGHIAFNEPFSSPNGKTHVQKLTTNTREVNSRFFDNDINKVPTHALTVGVATVLGSREVIILALGPKKAAAVKQCVEGALSQACPITALQTHTAGILVCDEPAIEELKVSTYRYFMDVEKENL